MNHYPHHIGDYDSDTAHLEWVEDMAYTRLLRLYYRTERPISADLNEACRLVRAKAKDERKAVETVLKEFFTLADDGWHNARADDEIANYKAKADANRRNGKAGGRPRKTQEEPANNPTGFCEPQTTETHKNLNQNQNQNHTPIPPSGEFERFWAVWPKSERKQGKSKCYEVWKKKKLDPIAEQIISHVQTMSVTESWVGGYDPMPLTYLNRGAWDGAELPAKSDKPSHHASW